MGSRYKFPAGSVEGWKPRKSSAGTGSAQAVGVRNQQTPRAAANRPIRMGRRLVPCPKSNNRFDQSVSFKGVEPLRSKRWTILARRLIGLPLRGVRALDTDKNSRLSGWGERICHVLLARELRRPAGAQRLCRRPSPPSS